MSIFYVYAYFEPEACEPFYIGKGQGDRAWWHLKAAKWSAKTAFYKKLVSLDYKAEVVLLLNNLTETEAFAEEVKFITHYGRRNLNKGPLFNLTDGGDGVSGHVVSIETRNKISNSNTGKPKTLTDADRLSRVERGRKLKLFNIGKISNRRRPVLAKFCGQFYRKYEALRHVEFDGYRPSHVLKSINTGYEAYGLQWEYA